MVVAACESERSRHTRGRKTRLHDYKMIILVRIIKTANLIVHIVSCDTDIGNASCCRTGDDGSDRCRSDVSSDDADRQHG